MGFRPGHPKVGGKKKGTKNKSRVLRVEEAMLAAGIDPVSRILELLPTLKERDQVQTLLELMRYIQPQVRAEVRKEIDPELEKLRQLPDEELQAVAFPVSA